MKKLILLFIIITLCVNVMGCIRIDPAAGSETRISATPESSPVKCIYVVFQCDSAGMSADEFQAKLTTTIGVMRKRLDQKGYLNATIVQKGTDKVRIEIPSETENDQEISDTLESLSCQGLLEFRDEAGDTKLTGADVLQSYEFYEDNQWVVMFKFNEEGAELFGDLTADAYNNGTDITITLDGKTISTAGVNDGPIYGGSAVIKGGANDDGTVGFTKDAANDLAIQIQSGALPLKLKMTEHGTGYMSGS